MAGKVVTVALAHEGDFEGFREAARRLALAGVEPALTIWEVPGGRKDLFGTAPAGTPPPALPDAAGELRVPRAFLALAEAVACHRSPSRFPLLYRLLWRLRAEPHLLERATDPDVELARRMEKAVRRDEHKMHAFVRFRCIGEGEEAAYFAWFEPDHFIERRVAGFFVRRFAAMRWSILTPRAGIHWDGERLRFGPGGRRADVPHEDAQEALWLTYYANIFNPARLKVKAMQAEMPKKYWRNLPEARLIPDLIAGAQERTRAMVAAAPTPVPLVAERLRARAPGEAGPADELDALRHDAQACQRCPLHGLATQTVFGEGDPQARLLVVGEQPGDQEDLTGRPFVGPAGQLFDAALAKAGIDRAGLYITNAVKHFKYEPRGKRRIHKRPDAGEIAACRWWLARELALVRPRLVLALGATAVQGLLGSPAKILEMRGRFFETQDGPTLLATVHPSYILRLPDPAARAAEEARFVEDLRRAADWLAADAP